MGEATDLGANDRYVSKALEKTDIYVNIAFYFLGISP